MSNDVKIAEVEAYEDIMDVRVVATELGLTFSGNTGIDTLKGKVIAALKEDKEEAPVIEEPVLDNDEDEEEIEVAKAIPNNRIPVEELLEMDANKVDDPKIRRQVIRAKAMRLHRVRITNLDPNDSTLEGGIVTVVNKYLGKVSKFIPFGEAAENGYHVEKVLLDRMRSQKYALRKEIKGNKFGVKQYKTVMVPKYSIEELPPLTKEEIKALAERQAAANAIG